MSATKGTVKHEKDTGGHWGALWGGVSQPSRGCMIYSGHNVVVRRCANVSWLPNIDRITSSGSATTESTALSWVQNRGEKVGEKYEKKKLGGSGRSAFGARIYTDENRACCAIAARTTAIQKKRMGRDSNLSPMIRKPESLPLR